MVKQTRTPMIVLVFAMFLTCASWGQNRSREYKEILPTKQMVFLHLYTTPQSEEHFFLSFWVQPSEIEKQFEDRRSFELKLHYWINLLQGQPVPYVLYVDKEIRKMEVRGHLDFPIWIAGDGDQKVYLHFFLSEPFQKQHPAFAKDVVSWIQFAKERQGNLHIGKVEDGNAIPLK